MRLIIVSNRLPVTVSREDGVYSLKKGAGGLVSGLSDFLNSIGESGADIDDYLWLGWPGLSVPKKDETAVRDMVGSNYNAHPVFLSKELMDNVYLGFCNRTIWPLFHYFPTYVKYESIYWEQYKKVNEIFRDELLKIIKPDDILWVHDYHLMLLPEMLREKVDNPVGFFLHIPFPSYEMYRMLPGESRNAILEGIAGADLVGFHTHDYSQYYLRCVRRILGAENHMGTISFPRRVTRVDTFPMGIDFEKFNKMETGRYEDTSKDSPERKIILSVDRLDYSKGIINRLQGFEMFLRDNPVWRGKVILNMIVVPSRTGVYMYQKIKRSLDEMVGNINGAYGSVDWVPVIYRFTSLPHEELIALYRTSDAALITPLRDGMNLVAKEYVASLNHKKGVLILSEFAGAAVELSETVLVNPNNADEIAGAIREALEMPLEEQERRNSIMQERLNRYNVTRWADDFVRELCNIRSSYRQTLERKILTDERSEKLIEQYKRAKKRIIFVNYDGTLVPYSDDSAPLRPGEKLLNLLEGINEKPDTDIVILSGRSKKDLEMLLGGLNINLTAEHGSWIRKAGRKEWDQLKPMSAEWKDEVLDILEIYTDRLPGAYIDEKEFSVSWYYHRSNIEQSRFLAREVNEHLLDLTSNLDVQVIHGNRVIEVANSGINKGELALHWLSMKEYDFIMAIGAGWADELLFRTLPPHAFTFRVGKVQTDARYLLDEQKDAVTLLESLTA